MLSAGWQAHKLNAPGKFLISAPEHDTPRRARAYLLTDQAVSDTAREHANLRPELDEVSMHALDERPPNRPTAPWTAPSNDDEEGTENDPEAILWAALCLASEDGIPVADLVAATGMSHRWVNYRLRALVDAGQAIQIRRGIWRATRSEGDAT